jgi:hypothetical protein
MAGMTGLFLALALAHFARMVGLDRDRAFYPLNLMVVASYYMLFALAGGAASEILWSEAIFIALFIWLATAAFRGSLWLAAAGLAGHGLFDLLHAQLIVNPGVPPFWPAFCAGFDLTAAACLATLLLRGKFSAAAR